VQAKLRDLGRAAVEAGLQDVLELPMASATTGAQPPHDPLLHTFDNSMHSVHFPALPRTAWQRGLACWAGLLLLGRRGGWVQGVPPRLPQRQPASEAGEAAAQPLHGLLMLCPGAPALNWLFVGCLM
jgi:hypothetical protein